MSKWIYRLALSLVAIYFALHLALGSSPVQRRVVAEIRRALAGFGFDLQIESIEFSAFSPRIYLNRVTLNTLPKAPIQLESPIPIDKIKIEFQPLALLTKRIVIEEVALFNPRLNLPSADKLYARINRVLSKRKPVQVQGDKFTLVVKKAGFVDAFFDVSVVNPPLAVRSRSLTAFVQMAVADQQNVTITSSNVDFQRGKMAAAFSQVDLDLDITRNSVRLNRAILEGEGLSLNVKGTAGLPIEKSNQSFNLSYDVKVPLALLNRVPEFKGPQLTGVVNSAGTVKVAGGRYSGNGQLSYEGVNVDEYQIGKGGLAFRLNENKAEFSDLLLYYGGGSLSSKALSLELNAPYLLTGQLQLKEVWLHEVLNAIDSRGALARLQLTGPMNVRGTLSKPFEIRCDLKATFPQFAVLKRGETEIKKETTVIQLPGGDLDTTLIFGSERLNFQTNARVLDGKLFADGYVGYDNRSKVKVKAENVSLTKLERVAALPLAGVADLYSEVEVGPSELKISGAFETKDGYVAGLKLGEVHGQAQFQDLLLSFDNLEIAGQLEPIRGNGFVDFNPAETHYKFHTEAKRLTLKEAFRVFEKRPLDFRPAEGGEVSARVSVEGGHDSEGLEVIASGQMRSFKWYGEDWLSSSFFVTFRPHESEVRRLVLLKKSGGIEVKARFQDERPSEISFTSHGLRVEELSLLGKAPVSGELVGSVKFRGPLAELNGNGELKLVRTAFRGKAFPDSVLKLRSDTRDAELQALLLGESLRARLTKGALQSRNWEALISFEQFDFAPFASVLGGKDIPTVIDWLATGEVTLNGDLTDWRSLSGNGAFSRVELGLQGTPMRNLEPVRMSFNKGAIEVNRFSLVGRDSQLGMEVFYDPEKEIRASIDGKMDLQFLQPLLTGVEYGAGKVSLGLRITGRPGDTAWLGNVILEDGTFRITGLRDEFRNANAQLSLGQNKINVERFEARVNGGTLIVGGDVGFGNEWAPNLVLKANRVELRTGDYLATRLSGDLFLRGNHKPYLLGGTCKVHEARLTRFVTEPSREKDDAILKFDVACDARDKLYVTTDVMNAEFKGDFHLLGTNSKVGLTGSVESVRGNVLFRERVFKLTSAHVRFESPEEIIPRFSVAANTLVTSSSASQSSLQAASQYDVNLQVFGTPKDYRLILTSTPELTEPDIIALLLLGAPGRNEDGNLMDFGTTLMGQIPIQSKLQSELGFDIRLKTQPGSSASTGGVTQTASKSSTTSDTQVPSVSIQKEITDRTKVSYSNTLEATPVREFKIEHMLDENVTVNGIAVDRSRGGTESVQTTQSYGLEIRYRHPFE